MESRVAITGVGPISCVGFGIEDFWDNVANGKSGIAPITQFDPAVTPVKIAGEVKDFKPRDYIKDRKSIKIMYRNVQLGLAAAKLAIENSGLDTEKVDPLRFGSIIGSGGGGFDEGPGNKDLAEIIKASWDENNKSFSPIKFGSTGIDRLYPLWLLKTLPNNVFCYVSIYYNVQGFNDNIINSFAGGSQAIGDAFRAIKRGDADIIVAGGYDTLVMPNNISSYYELNMMPKNSESISSFRPFDRSRDGFLVGEGAGMVILEELEHAKKRKAKIFAEIIGYGNSADAYDIYKPSPDGDGLCIAIKMACKNGSINPCEIDYINADGIATVESDKAETCAIKNVLADDAYKTAISSIKPITGHVGAASGALEFIACAMSISNKVVPPTINLQEPDPLCDLDYCPATARETNIKMSLSLNQGLNGQNSALIIKKYEG